MPSSVLLLGLVFFFSERTLRKNQIALNVRSQKNPPVSLRFKNEQVCKSICGEVKLLRPSQKTHRYSLVLVYARPSLCIKLFLEHSLHSLLRRSLISRKSCVYQKSSEDKKKAICLLLLALGLFALQRTSLLLKYIELTQWLRSKNCLGMEFHVYYVLKLCSKKLFFGRVQKMGMI